MIQQIKNTKSDKQLTKNDLYYVIYASCLNFFHNNTMFKPYPLGIYYCVDLHYVKREDSNSYQYYYYRFSTGAGGTTFSTGMWSRLQSSGTKSSADIEKIHPHLLCSKNYDERLLILCAYGTTVNTRPHRSKLGFFILNPNYYSNFQYKLVITPKPGLFPAKF